MKVIILAGGCGTRLAEYTDIIPKPMVRIGEYPILWHIMQTYSKYGYNDFYIALGFKAEVIKEYFLNYRGFNSDFTVDLSTGAVTMHQTVETDWKVTLVNTGLETMTGGRLKRMRPFIGDEPLLITYGDGVANIDIDALVSYHKSHGKMVTITAVHPVARFGELDLEDGKVSSFKEKPQINQGWINGGYFVIEPEFFNFLEDDSTILEQEPLEKVAEMGEMMAFKHKGYWQCMDTKRDCDHLQKLWQSGEAPWVV